MKKIALIVALLMLVTIAEGVTISNDDKDFRAGLKSYNSKNFKVAVSYFKEYIKRKPDPTAYYLIGYSLYKLGKFSESEEYFKNAYILDPDYSLKKFGLIRKASGEVVPKESTLTKMLEPAIETKKAKQVSAAKTKATQSTPKMPEAAVIPEQTGSTEPKPAKMVHTDPADRKAKESEVATAAIQKSATSVQSVPQQAEQANLPQTTPTPPVSPVLMPKQMPAAGLSALIAMVAALGMILVFIGLAVYLYYSLCLFLIAKKLAVHAPWTAWVPIVQLWTFVISAGKPGWWTLLFLVPIVNLFIGIYVWMCITENLGKNKWLGLLILVPLIGILYPGWLAFSRTESSSGYTPPDNI